MSDEVSNPLGAYLARHAVPADLVRPGVPMPTVAHAAQVLAVPPEHVVKSIVFRHKKDASRACLAIAPGQGRVQIQKVARALGLSQLKLASPENALAAMGYAVGGIPPVGHARTLPVVIDARVLLHEWVYGGGGDEWHMLRIAPAEIVRLTGAVAADILEDGCDAPPDAP
jgi:Cys-tRNA(Pro) deacylase